MSSVDFTELLREKSFAEGLTNQFRDRAKLRLRAVSFEVERNVKIRMPIDTGRARGSWGHADAPAGAGDNVWQEEDNGMTITQGSNVVYVPVLNEGHSKQAPAGFIDAEYEKGADMLLNGLLDEAADLFT